VQVLKLKPLNESAVRSALINVYSSWGKWRELMEECRVALERDKTWDSPERWAARAQLERQWARAHAELGEWAEAARHFGDATQRGPSLQATWHQLALAQLKAGDEAAYRKTCGEALKRFGRPGLGPTANDLAWTCVVGPGAVDNPQDVVDRAKQAVDRFPGQYAYLNTLGAALYRAGNHEKAYETLMDAERAYGKQGPAPADGGAPLDWLFLAMVQQHRPGQAEDARKWFDKADTWIKSNAPKLTENAPDSALTWDKRLELHLLRDEARKELKLPNP
jgi:tetratricopeptide (TPR) repeat protein